MCKLKQSRLLCLLFVLILCFQSFGLNVSAAESDNLVDSNIAEWELMTNYDSTYNHFVVTETASNNSNYFVLQTYDNTKTNVNSGVIFQRCSLNSGSSYSISFHLPNSAEIKSIYKSSRSDDALQKEFQQHSLSVGVGYITSDGSFVFPDNLVLLTINGSNSPSYFGKTLSASFDMPSISGEPFVYFRTNLVSGSTVNIFYVGNFSLTEVSKQVEDDNDDDVVEGNTDGNLIDSNLSNWVNVSNISDVGFPINVTPSGDVYRLTLAQQDYPLYYGALIDDTSLVAGRSYTLSFKMPSRSECNAAFGNSYSASVYKNHFENSEIRIGIGFLDSSNEFTWYESGLLFHITKDNYTNFFGKSMKASFVPTTYTGTPVIFINITSLDGVKHTFYFSDFQLIDNEKEKEDGMLSKIFEWFQKRFDSIGESFSNLGNKVSDLKNSIVSKFIELKESFENKITDLKESFQNKIDELKQIFQNKIDEVKQGLIDLKNDLIDGIKSLFIPDEAVISDLKSDLDMLLKAHLGIIYTCSDLFTEFLTRAFDIIFEAPDTFEIKIPEVSFEAGGTTVPVFSAQSIDFSFMEKPVFKTLYGMYKVALYIFFGALEVKYALRTYRKVINN